MSHAGKVLLNLVARRRNRYCEAKGLLPEEQYGFRPDRSTTDMMFVMRRLQGNERKAGVSLFMCFIDLQKANDTVDCTLLWQVIPRIGAQPQRVVVIQQFHDEMRAYVRRGDGICSGGARTTARMRAMPAVVQNLLCSRADRCPPNIQRGYGHPRRAGAPEGIADVDGTGAAYGLRSSCGV